MTDADRDLLVLAMTAYAEARGEGQDGIRAQIHSVLNRHAVAKWYSRKTLTACCLLGYAYSAWNSNDPNRVAAAEAAMDDALMAMCATEAQAAVAGDTQDPTSGATHYYAAGSKEPNWVTGLDSDGKQAADPAIFCIQIGRHLFYRNVA